MAEIDRLLQAKGRIFDIQKYSIHDGPGIRTIVFLKGCALRCRWCCNPESQSFDIETMHMSNGEDKVMGRDVTVKEVMDVVRQDSFYYQRSGGGLTLSGGEALLQPNFAIPLLTVSKLMDINTAIETTGFQKWDILKQFLDVLDYVLMDIKHMDSDKHKAFTGQPNGLILENAQRIADTGKDLTIRVPVIPGFNNTPEEISEIADFAASLPNVKKLHLLPYHRMGQDKYEWLGRDYSLKNVEPMTDAYMQMLLKAAKRPGLAVRIGGE